MVEGIKYDCFFYKMGVKRNNDKLDMGYFIPLMEKIIPCEEIEAEKQEFLSKNETIFKIDSKVIYYNTFCREWTEGNKTFLEYIIGFVSLNQ